CWIIQVVGHHYNPNWTSKMPADERTIWLGPTNYIQRVILPQFWTPELRAFGIHHAALTWMPPADRSWTTAKSVGANMLAPILDYDAGSAVASASSSGGAAGYGKAAGGGMMP